MKGKPDERTAGAAYLSREAEDAAVELHDGLKRRRADYDRRAREYNSGVGFFDAEIRSLERDEMICAQRFRKEHKKVYAAKNRLTKKYARRLRLSLWWQGLSDDYIPVVRSYPVDERRISDYSELKGYAGRVIPDDPRTGFLTDTQFSRLDRILSAYKEKQDRLNDRLIETRKSYSSAKHVLERIRSIRDSYIRANRGSLIRELRTLKALEELNVHILVLDGKDKAPEEHPDPDDELIGAPVCLSEDERLSVEADICRSIGLNSGEEQRAESTKTPPLFLWDMSRSEVEAELDWRMSVREAKQNLSASIDCWDDADDYTTNRMSFKEIVQARELSRRETLKRDRGVEGDTEPGSRPDFVGIDSGVERDVQQMFDGSYWLADTEKMILEAPDDCIFGSVYATFQHVEDGQHFGKFLSGECGEDTDVSDMISQAELRGSVDPEIDRDVERSFDASFDMRSVDRSLRWDAEDTSFDPPMSDGRMHHMADTSPGEGNSKRSLAQYYARKVMAKDLVERTFPDAPEQVRAVMISNTYEELLRGLVPECSEETEVAPIGTLKIMDTDSAITPQFPSEDTWDEVLHSALRMDQGLASGPYHEDDSLFGGQDSLENIFAKGGND